MSLNVLSLFDGISCGRVALERAGHKVDLYLASEVDKHAISIAQKNYPDTEQLGDVRQIRGEVFTDELQIDLLIGGSPCQGFSTAGHGLNFEGSALQAVLRVCPHLRRTPAGQPQRQVSPREREDEDRVARRHYELLRRGAHPDRLSAGVGPAPETVLLDKY